MGKLFDYLMTGNWEETQRIALYKKIGNKLDSNDLKSIKENNKTPKVNGKNLYIANTKVGSANKVKTKKEKARTNDWRCGKCRKFFETRTQYKKFESKCPYCGQINLCQE